MFAKILEQFSPENRVIILELIHKKVDNDLHRLKLETDPLYVLERMGLEFSKWREFYYRGYVFICQKFFETPQNESSPKYDYRVRLGICSRDEVPKEGCSRYELFKLSGKTTREISSKFGFDNDRCDLLDIKPFIEYLIQSSPMSEDEYNISSKDEFAQWGFSILDKDLNVELIPELESYIQIVKESRLAKKLGIDFHISPPSIYDGCVYFNE
jgi:hypothetical protein